MQDSSEVQAADMLGALTVGEEWGWRMPGAVILGVGCSGETVLRVYLSANVAAAVAVAGPGGRGVDHELS